MSDVSPLQCGQFAFRSLDSPFSFEGGYRFRTYEQPIKRYKRCVAEREKKRFFVGFRFEFSLTECRLVLRCSFR